MQVSDWTGSCIDWESELSVLKASIGSVFGRSETRVSACAFIDGLLSGVARKTSWMLSEAAGHARPYRLQSLLGRSSWSADRMRDLVRAYALDALGDPGGVLVIDETGFMKKGGHSVGVGRQYSGTAGRIENCQVGVFAAYASRFGHALIDRRLYLPKDWTGDGARRGKAQVPDDIAFATKPAIAREMISRTLDAGVSCAWVLADSVYGCDSRLRGMLEERDQPYVLAVRSDHTLRFLRDGMLIRTDPATIAASLAEEEWRTLSAGEGSKGPRLYDWARVRLSWSAKAGFERWLLIRRSRQTPHKSAYYIACAPAGTSPGELAGAAGLRWTIEECFLRAKDDLGLDHCEARSWHGWHRHMSLVMAAGAFLARLSAERRRLAWSKPIRTRTGTVAA